MSQWKRLLGAFLFFAFSFTSIGEEEHFLSHDTSRGFETVKSDSEFHLAYVERLLGLSNGRNDKAESSSIGHQKDVIQSVKGKIKVKLEGNGFNYKFFKRGVIDSDLGKLSEFKKLLYEKSAKSDQLLSFLKLQGSKKSNKVLKQLLVRFPEKQRALLNPALTNDQLRGIFKRNPVLQHYLHELPGMADPLYFFEAGVIDEETFRKQLLANMFHNGPHAGFWKSYSEQTIPYLVGKDKLAKKFFLNTVYEGEKNKSGFIAPKYPGPLSFEGYVHVVFDRLSQATRGGVEKIFEEIRKFPGQTDVEKMAGLIFDNPISTQEQFSALYDLASDDPDLTEKQRKLVIRLVEVSQHRINEYIKHVAKIIEFKIDGGSPSLVLKPNKNKVMVFKSDGSLVTSDLGKPAVTRKIANKKEFGDELKDSVIKLLVLEEQKNGNPLKDLEL